MRQRRAGALANGAPCWLGHVEGEATLCGVFAETDDATGLALRIEPVCVVDRLKQTMTEVA